MNDVTRTRTGLIEYLKVIFDHEILLNEQKTMLHQLERYNIQKESVKVPEKIKNENYTGGGISGFFSGCLPVALGGFIFAVISGGILFGVIEIPMMVPWYMYYFVCIGIGEAGWAWLVMAGEKSLKEDHSKKVLENIKQRDQAEQENIRLEQEYELKVAAKNEMIDRLNLRINEIKEVLDLLYSDNLIYVKYRNLVAISAFREYIESGRANTLVDAYDKFEVEYRLDAIQDTLNRIDNKLDLVLDKLDNMTYELTNALRDNEKNSERFCQNMVQYMDKIVENQKNQEKNISLIQNDQKCIAENTKVLSYIKNTENRSFDMTPFVKMYNTQMYK